MVINDSPWLTVMWPSQDHHLHFPAGDPPEDNAHWILAATLQYSIHHTDNILHTNMAGIGDRPTTILSVAMATTPLVPISSWLLRFEVLCSSLYRYFHQRWIYLLSSENYSQDLVESRQTHFWNGASYLALPSPHGYSSGLWLCSQLMFTACSDSLPHTYLTSSIVSNS